MNVSMTRLTVAAVFFVCLAGLTVAQDKAAPKLPDTVELVRDVQFGTGGGRPLLLDIVRPKQTPADPMPVVVFIHGGGWRGGSRQSGIPLTVPLAEAGFFCPTIEYRLSAEATFPAQIEDVKCAIRFLRSKADEYHIDHERIGVWGLSAGGHLVSLLGTSGDVSDLEGTGGHAKYSSRVNAVCNWFGPTDMPRMLETANENGISAVSGLIGGTLDEKRDVAVQASPLTYVSADDPPFLTMHGELDPTVPIEQAKLLDQKLREVGVPTRLFIVKGAGHGFRGPEYQRMAIDFFQTQLAK